MPSRWFPSNYFHQLTLRYYQNVSREMIESPGSSAHHSPNDVCCVLSKEVSFLSYNLGKPFHTILLMLFWAYPGFHLSETTWCGWCALYPEVSIACEWYVWHIWKLYSIVIDVSETNRGFFHRYGVKNAVKNLGIADTVFLHDLEVALGN